MGVAHIRSWLHERHSELHMRRWLLEFDDAAAEDAFRRYDDAAGLQQIRPALWIGIAFTIAYGIIDLLFDDAEVLSSTVIRFAVVIPVFAAVLALHHRMPFVERHLQTVAVVLLGVTLLALGTATAWTTDLPTEYVRTSCAVTLIGGIGLLRLRMPAACALAVDFVVVSMLLTAPRADLEWAVVNVAPTVGMASIGLLVAYALERLRRTDFASERAVALEKARSDDLLHNILPVSIADRLRSEEGAIAESAAEVSVLFSDIVGFTPVAESLAPEQLVHLLDTMFREFDELCDQRGIEKIKTVGDAYMAVAGLPVADADHAASMAELALDMQRASTRLSAAWPSPIALRIGIASGPVVAGVIGRRKFAYDLWGDTVNTASRMESHGRPHRIQVSATTHDLLEDRYMFSDPQVVEVKGKGPMTTYFLLGPWV